MEAIMKRCCLLVMIMVWAAASAFAQVEFGVRVGGAYSSLIQHVDSRVESGGHFGYGISGLMEMPVYKGFSFRPEVSFINQGGSYYSRYSEEGMAARNSYSYYSIQVPLNISYTFFLSDVRLSVFLGPAFDFSLFGKMKTRGTDVSTDIDFGKDEEPNLRTFDFGINVGMNVEYNRFFFAVSNLTGVLDRRTVKRVGESTLFQNNVTFSLGYIFRK